MTRTQKTIAQPVILNGIGLHSGIPVTLTLRPAPVDAGVTFVRVDLPGDNRIPAHVHHVVDTRLCTVLGNANGARVGTIEHLMAALRGSDITNLTIEVNAPEIPAMDGSAAEFLAAIDAVGVVDQGVPQKIIKIIAPITVQDGDKTVSLTPADRARFSGTIAYQNPVIGTQDYTVELLNGNFRHEIASARTFGLESEIDMMRAAGLAQGGSLDNAVVVGDTAVLNPDGLRFTDEFIRHKLLDAMGDLMLAGRPILGAYHGVKMSHAMNHALLQAMFAKPEAWVEG